MDQKRRAKKVEEMGQRFNKYLIDKHDASFQNISNSLHNADLRYMTNPENSLVKWMGVTKTLPTISRFTRGNGMKKRRYTKKHK